MLVKKDLRQDFLKKRLALPERTRREKSAAICTRLKELFDSNRVKTVMVYFSVNGEVDLETAIHELFHAGKKVLAPKVVGRDIQPISLTSPDDVTRGFKGIPEPDGSVPFMGAIDLIFVPGLAFDRARHRLGYGGGFYDRFISHHPESYSAGCFYAEQFCQDLPKEHHDISLSCVVTEDRIH